MPKKSAKILVVDDERIITMHLQELLVGMGYDVAGTASSGSEAVAKAGELRPDLIFMDIIMPGELNGLDAASIIREKMGIPVIFLTAFADEKIVAKAIQSEPFGYIIKPFQEQELRPAIEIALYKKGMEERLRQSEEKYRTVVDQSRDGIGVLQDGVFRFVNPALFEMLGSPEDLDRTSFLEYFAEDSRERAEEIFYGEVHGGAFPRVNRFNFHRPDGSSIPVETSGTVIEYGKRPASLIFFRNTEERGRIEQLLDHLVNEINEHNQVVISNIEKTLSGTTDESLRAQLRQVLDQLFYNVNIVKKAYRLLQVTCEEDALVATDPVDGVNQAAAMVKAQYPDRSIQVNMHILGTVPAILADEFLEDAIALLLENAVENAKSPTAQVEVSVGSVNVNGAPEVEIRIEDPNASVPDNVRERLFDPTGWSSAGREGEMFGLSIARSVLERYSGDLRLEDLERGGPGGGCAFVARFPSMARESGAKEGKENGRRPSRPGDVVA